MIPSGLAVDGQGQIFIGDRRPAGGDAEDDRFIRIFTPSGKESGIVAVFRGAVDKLAVDTSERMYLFNRAEQQIVTLRLEQTFVRPGGPLPSVGYYFSQAFDSTTPGTRWHKLVLQADIPANTQVRVSYLIADDVEVFPTDTEHISLEELNDLCWSAPPLVNPHEALIRSPVGRYLWLRLQLIGQERLAPTVQSLGVYFPRTSYLRYLPAVYQEEARSRDFLERFLSLFETFLAQLEGRIDHIVRYFDASATDVVVGDFLRSLASWLAITVDEAWSEEQRRTLVQRAPDLYKKRGTREGIAEIIAIFTGTQPLIVEHFQLRCAQEPAVQQLLARLYGEDPYCFCVLLPVAPGRRDPAQTRQLVQRLVEAEKPAHTCAGILQLQPWVSLDMHTYLGINTYLSEPDPRLDIGAVMPRDTVLTERTAEAGQLERRARLGVDTILT
jgi:phage tail-like protein